VNASSLQKQRMALHSATSPFNVITLSGVSAKARSPRIGTEPCCSVLDFAYATMASLTNKCGAFQAAVARSQPALTALPTLAATGIERRAAAKPFAQANVSTPVCQRGPARYEDARLAV
jgi:hypothetical protein